MTSRKTLNCCRSILNVGLTLLGYCLHVNLTALDGPWRCHMRTPRIEREQVILAALVLLDQEGLEGLTLRKLAQTLQIQAPSLYWHFDDKQSLLDGVADALIEQVARSIPADLPWDSSVRRIAKELRSALLRHRDGARLFTGTYAVSENVLRVNEAMIDAFVRAGTDAALASTFSFSVVYYVLGFAMEEQALDPRNALDLASRKQAFFEMTKARFPRNWAAREAIFSSDFDARFMTGLDLLIEGVAQQVSRIKRRSTERSSTVARATKAKAPG